MRDDVVLACSHLRRVFGRAGRDEFVAIEDVSLEVGAGRVHALLGPNGAGKTTTVRMCAALLSPTSGAVRVDGVDAVRHPERARARLGLVLGGAVGKVGHGVRLGRGATSARAGGPWRGG